MKSYFIKKISSNIKERKDESDCRITSKKDSYKEWYIHNNFSHEQNERKEIHSHPPSVYTVQDIHDSKLVKHQIF